LSYPVLDGCPILINESNSVFTIDEYERREVTTMDLRAPSAKQQTMGETIRRWISSHVPPITRNVSDFTLLDALGEITSELENRPRILVIGGGDAELQIQSDAELIYSDVASGPLTQLICDAHDIPFPDEYFDGVVACSVLEHVADPYRCVDEVYRVLKQAGFVYAITPFMQQVHMDRYDFTRFTHLGHRRLFRRFSEERSGVSNAQGTVMAWSIERFFAGFSDNLSTYSRLRTLARFFAFPFLLFDKILSSKSAAYDAASAYYFFGRKSESTLTDRELIQLYRGVHQ
jgi:SAM-dependent methyltransferase